MKRNPFAKRDKKDDDFLNLEQVGEPLKTGSLIRRVWRDKETKEYSETYEHSNEDV